MPEAVAVRAAELRRRELELLRRQRERLRDRREHGHLLVTSNVMRIDPQLFRLKF